MRKNEKITALYERLSRDDFGKDDDQQRESNSISNQKAMLEDFAARQGFTNIVHFTDDGISGTCFDRPGFLAMMKEVEAGNVEYLCIKDMSRMGRDYLKVGQIMEILRQRGVRLIAINDGVDSARGDDDFTPFRNIMNEYYARDTSRKIRSTFQSKGKSGKHLTGTVIYGYLWNEARDQWLVDPEAADVVKRIFTMTIEGYGPYQIASKLKEEKILIPSAYLAQHGEGVNKNKTFKDVYGWGSSTICNLLEKREYLGHTINFKTRKHFKDKKSHYVPEDEWTIFENTHEAIIDQQTFDLVQKIRGNVRRYPDGWGEAAPLTGLLYCADCGGKMYVHRTNNGKRISQYTCSQYTKVPCGTLCKTQHRINEDVVLSLVSEMLKAIAEYAKHDRAEFVRVVQEAQSSQQTAEVRKQRTRLATAKQRVSELEVLLCKIYEDNILGKLSDSRYATLDAQYEKEQSELTAEISVLEKAVKSYEKHEKDADRFIALIDKYENFDKLTVRGNKWFRHSQSKGGYPIDFVMEFYGKSFPEAVQLLTGESGEGQSEASTAPPTAFHLPLHNRTADRAIQYLCESRGLNKTLVEDFLLSGDIYEDAKRHNVVFVGRDRNGTPRYAHVRGTADTFRQDIAGSDKSYPFRYEGNSNQLFVFEAPIDLLSFICLYPQDWQSRSYLALGGVSGKALDRFLSERKDTRKVFLCLDSDTAGSEACTRLAQSIPGEIAVIRLVPARKDWNDVLRQQGDIPSRKFIAETITLRELPTAQPVPMLRMADVELTSVDWLWFPYIPFGKLTIIQGNPGEGKTYFAMRLAAACTNRKPLPGMETLEPFNIIYQTAEDGLGDTVKPRLIEADADLERVLVIDDRDTPLTLADERIARAIRENSARLVIIDPVQAFLGADVDMNRANEVRPIFRSLGDIAQATGCAIVLIGHLNKAAGTQSTYRGLGSIDITAAVRSLLFIGKLKGSPTTRVLIHEKSSLAPPGQSLAFSLGDEKGFEWIGAYDITADELLDGTDTAKTESKTAQAQMLILELLADGKRMPSAELEKAVNERGISSRTMRTAKSRIGDRLVTEKDGTAWVCYLRD